MSLSRTLTEARSPLAPGEKRRILLTGAAGRIGSYFAEHFHTRYDMRLMVRESDQNIDRLRAFGEVVCCDLSDLDGLKAACDGIDTVVHLAANPEPAATWNDLLPSNIVGVYNMFVAAKAAGCSRVVYASSVHAIGGHRTDVQIRTTDPVNPATLYGVTKCFGEAMARYMAEQEGLSAIAMRIGAYQTEDWARNPDHAQMVAVYVSRNDMNRLIHACIEAEKVQFAIVHGLSANRFNMMDLSDTQELVGYDPQDDMARENPLLHSLASPRRHPEEEPAIQEEQSGIREDL